MNIFDIIYERIESLLKDNFDIICDKRFSAEFTKDKSHGDISTNVAMIYAKHISLNPREFSEKISVYLRDWEVVSKVEIAGPGFINLTMKPSFWHVVLQAILSEGSHYGDAKIGEGSKVNLEYVSTNPTGPMHIGHTRCAIFGDVIASLLTKVGYKVTKEYYINDAGNQIDVLAESAFMRYQEACGIKIDEIPQGLYPGEYLINVGRDLYEKYGDSLLDADYLPIIRKFATEKMMDLIRDDLSLLGVHHEVFTSELEIRERGIIEKAIEELKAKALVYEGTLEKPKGHEVDESYDNLSDTKLLFRSTNFGDDQDRTILKSNGELAYFAADLGYVRDKIDRGFDKLVFVLGADHLGYKKRLLAACKALGGDKVAGEIYFCQMVNFVKNGQPLKMSKRAGNYVTANQVVEEVGKDALRFMMMTRSNDVFLDFDLEKVMEQSKDNPVFYVQYAFARCNSILRKSEELNPQAFYLANSGKVNYELLQKEEETDLIKFLANFPKMLESAASTTEPHKVAYYLYDLASLFHSIWNKGREEDALKFVVENIELCAARISIIRAIIMVMKIGLDILGVTPVERM